MFMDQFRFSIVAFCTASAMATPSYAQNSELTFLGPEKQMVKYHSITLTNEQQVELKRFSSRVEYFGGFAVNAENGAWGYSNGFISQNIAEQAAVKICEGNSRGRPCTLIAAILPGSLSPSERHSFALNSLKESPYRNEFLPKVRRQKAGRYAAFAIGSRAFGYDVNAKTPDIAKLKARRACEKAEAYNMRKSEISVRNAISVLGGYKCKVVEVIGS